MQTTTPTQHLRPQPRPRRPGPSRAQARARQSGGPLDRATYSCSCGYVFRAEVTTSVGCPSCGVGQAW